MGHVVGDHLVGIDAAAGADRGAGLVNQALGQIDRVGGAGEVRRGGRRHGQRPYWLPKVALFPGDGGSGPAADDRHERGKDHRVVPGIDAR